MFYMPNPTPHNIKLRQQRFVRDLMLRVQNDILNQIKEGKVPEEWDGHELRALIEHHASVNVSSLLKEDRKRMRAFKNTVIVNNL